MIIRRPYVLAGLAAAACALAVWTSALAARAAEPGAGGPREKVAVAGPVTREQANAWVRTVSAGPPDQPVARWRDPICPLVSGLPRSLAELMLERLSEDARAVGAPLGPRDCHPNLFIVAAGDPKALLRAWTKREPDLFGRDQAAIERMISVDRPVRVWRRVSSAGADGHMAARQSQAFIGGPGQTEKPVLNWADDSHLTSSTVRVIGGAAVVLGPDVKKVKVGQLADYIALTTFAEVDLDGDPVGAPSILLLFRPDAKGPPDGLSKSGPGLSEGALRRAGEPVPAAQLSGRAHDRRGAALTARRRPALSAPRARKGFPPNRQGPI